METNTLPHYDTSVNPTGCCPKFNPEGWDGQELHFEDKRFVHATTLSLMHVPINMSKVFSRVLRNIEAAGAYSDDDFIVLSRDPSPFEGEHFFAVTGVVPGEEMTSLSGDFVTKVFEGRYKNAPVWEKEMQEIARARGAEPGKVYFFFTTCPKCAEAYGKNYVVGVVEV